MIKTQKYIAKKYLMNLATKIMTIFAKNIRQIYKIWEPPTDDFLIFRIYLTFRW